MSNSSGSIGSVTKVVTRTEASKLAAATAGIGKGNIKNPIDGRCYLEKRLLLCPVGEQITNALLASCLHQISEMPNINVQVLSAVCAAVYMAEELEELSVNEMVRDAVVSQLNKLAQDMKALVEDAKNKFDGYVQAKLEEPALVQSPQSPSQPLVQDVPPSQGRSYVEAVVRPPHHANPRLAARESIRARQVVLEGIAPKSKFVSMSAAQLKGELNKVVNEAGFTGRGVRSAGWTKRKGLLIEMESDTASKWLSVLTNAFILCTEIRPDVVVKPRVFAAIVFNVPITFDPDDKKHI